MRRRKEKQRREGDKGTREGTSRKIEKSKEENKKIRGEENPPVGKGGGGWE